MVMAAATNAFEFALQRSNFAKKACGLGLQGCETKRHMSGGERRGNLRRCARARAQFI
jgi:hypothetical protein